MILRIWIWERNDGSVEGLRLMINWVAAGEKAREKPSAKKS